MWNWKTSLTQMNNIWMHLPLYPPSFPSPLPCLTCTATSAVWSLDDFDKDKVFCPLNLISKLVSSFFIISIKSLSSPFVWAAFLMAEKPVWCDGGGGGSRKLQIVETWCFEEKWDARAKEREEKGSTYPSEREVEKRLTTPVQANGIAVCWFHSASSPRTH